MVELCRRGRLRLLLLIVLVPALTLASAAAAQAAALIVNTTKDEMSSGDGKCSLREAVDAVNNPGTKTDCGTADTVSNLIVLRARTYQLSIPPASEAPAPTGVDNTCVNPAPPAPQLDENATGDLCVTSNAALTIAGRGSTTTIKGLPALQDRLMTVATQASVVLAELTMKGGEAPVGATNTLPACQTSGDGANGGAIYNTGSLITNMVTFQGNRAGVGGAGADTSASSGCAGGNGGAIYNDGTSPFLGSLVVQNTMFIADSAGAGGAGGSSGTSVPGGGGGPGGSGGGIHNDGGTLQVSNTTFSVNKAGFGGQGGESAGGNGGTGGDGAPGGGVYSTGGSLSVINGTFAGNQAGSGANGGNDTGGGKGGNGGAGANGGAVAVNDSRSGLRNATLQGNSSGAGGTGGTGSTGRTGGTSGVAGGLFVQSSKTADNMALQNTIVASSLGMNCFASPSTAIADDGHNLSFGDTTCPAVTNSDPKLTSSLGPYGGYTLTLALQPDSAAIDQVPAKGAGCPSTDQRTVRRPQGKACDIGAFEFARPKIEITTPRNGARYKRGSRVRADFRCIEGGITSPIVSCVGTVANGKPVNTSSLGRKSFEVTATDKQGNKTSKTVHYRVVR